MRRFASIASLGLTLILCIVAPAFGYDEPEGMVEDHQGSVLTACAPCHRPGPPNNTLCDSCHASHGSLGQSAGKGPHGLYASSTDRCDACHGVHDAGGPKLLLAATVTDTCTTCHDGTGGRGVYGAIEAQTGVDPAISGGMHRIDTTNVVPGGDPDGGGTATMAFGGEGGMLGCDDCHSPHDSNTVAAFTSERWRTSYNPVLGASRKTSKLLRQKPGGTDTAILVYGADWCAACHQGRTSGGVVHNHPVEDPATPGAFSYDAVARLSSDDPTEATVIGTMAGTNRGYLMPFPRTTGVGGQEGHAPICQQCHEDTRSVGTLTDSIGDAATYSVTATDGANPTDNPRFQNFPHETQNATMLVETDDDLCLNCHPTSQLP